MKILQIVRWSLRRLSPTERRYYFFLAFAQVLLPVFDFLGLASLAIVGSLLTRNNQVASYSGLLSRLDFLVDLKDIDIQRVVVFILLIISALFAVKTILSILLLRMNYGLLGKASTRLSQKMYKEYFDLDIARIQKTSVFQASDALNECENFATIGILGSASALIAEIALVFPMGIYLIYYSGLVSILIICYLMICSYFLHIKVSKTLESYGQIRARNNKLLEKHIHETSFSFREFFVANKLESQGTAFGSMRSKSAIITWKIFWVNSIPKYAFEIIFVLGLTILAYVEIQFLNNPESLAILLTFLFAGSRLMPSLLRIQASTNTLRMSYGASESLRELINNSELTDVKEVKLSTGPEKKVGDYSNLHCKDLVFKYEGKENATINISDLRIEQGERVGLVGRSGSGKSTLADLLMGVLIPSSGNVRISELTPKEFISRYPGRISYLPQTVNLLDTSIAENIAIGVQNDQIDVERLLEVLKMVNLDDFVLKLPGGIETRVGEKGKNLSGGQRQRVALARALYTRPSLLILDEATSSLDVESEDFITQSISSLSSDITILVIAHRLSTIKQLKRIIYLKDGSILADGTYSALMGSIPEFKRQSELSGY